MIAIESSAKVFANLAEEVTIPENGTLSRVIYVDDHIRVVLFAFDAGQELTEHTASMPAIVQIISGEARLTLGDEKVTAVPGTWVHMPARLQHAIYASTPLVMLLTMLRGGKAA